MLTVEIKMYDKEAGGRATPICDVGYSCECTIDRTRAVNYACRINFHGKYPVVAGEIRSADMFLLTGDDVEAQFAAVQRFFLSENGSIVGHARVRDGFSSKRALSKVAVRQRRRPDSYA